MTMPWSVRTADSVIARDAPMSHEWHYENGVMLKAFESVWRKTGDAKYLKIIQKTLDELIDPEGTIHSYRITDYNLDQVNMGKALFAVWGSTKDPRYKQAALLLREQLRWQPRTLEGGMWHKLIYPYQMWLDGIYMGTAFLAEFANTFPAEPSTSAAAGDWDDVAFQIITIEQHTRDPKTGLLYHAWDESKKQLWANPSTGCSSHFWGRALGWYAMALVDTLDVFPQDHPSRSALVAILQRSAEAIASVQNSSTGLWYQVLDQSERTGNYFEASASGMFVYALAKGVRRGTLDKKYIHNAKRAYNGMLEHFVAVDANGMVNLNWTCGGAGLGGSPYRDGTYQYYVGEKILTNDYKGLGPFIMASIEMER
jgi:unsaturated rhamnogalacturonyl hydrolase